MYRTQRTKRKELVSVVKSFLQDLQAPFKKNGYFNGLLQGKHLLAFSEVYKEEKRHFFVQTDTQWCHHLVNFPTQRLSFILSSVLIFTPNNLSQNSKNLPTKYYQTHLSHHLSPCHILSIVCFLQSQQPTMAQSNSFSHRSSLYVKNINVIIYIFNKYNSSLTVVLRTKFRYFICHILQATSHS